MTRPLRSALYIPAANPRAMQKARDLPADAIIFDLEDAVAPAEKEPARALLAAALAEDYGPRLRIVRINGLDTPWGAGDAAWVAAQAGAVDAVLLPKVAGPDDLDRLAGLLSDLPPDLPLWAMIETPAGVLNVAAIAAHPRLHGLVMGTNDLAKELGVRHRPDRLPLIWALSACLLAAKGQGKGKVILDGVYNAFRDDEGLRGEAEQGRDLGFDGKTLIHPGQLAAANRIFAPDPDEIALARRQIAAFEAAEAEGRGVAVLDGRIVENLHVASARRTLALAKAIEDAAG